MELHPLSGDDDAVLPGEAKSHTIWSKLLEGYTGSVCRQCCAARARRAVCRTTTGQTIKVRQYQNSSSPAYWGSSGIKPRRAVSTTKPHCDRLCEPHDGHESQHVPTTGFLARYGICSVCLDGRDADTRHIIGGDIGGDIIGEYEPPGRGARHAASERAWRWTRSRAWQRSE